MHLALTEAAHVQPATQGCTLMLSELLHLLVVAKHEASLIPAHTGAEKAEEEANEVKCCAARVAGKCYDIRGMMEGKISFWTKVDSDDRPETRDFSKVGGAR